MNGSCPHGGSIVVRASLLDLLRRQADAIGARRFHRHEAPELYDLARSAGAHRGRWLQWRGLRIQVSRRPVHIRYGADALAVVPR